MQSIPINAVTMRGWDRLYKEANGVFIRSDYVGEDDLFYLGLRMEDGAMRYLIGNDDAVKPFDTRQLLAFVRKHTEIEDIVVPVLGDVAEWILELDHLRPAQP